MARRVEVGVVGVGYWGPKLVRNLYDTPSANLSWVIDRDRARLERIGQQYPRVQIGERYDDLLGSSVEAVVIATPIRTHYALAKAALLRGKHVMIEKPLAASSAECEELIDIADARGLTLMVGHTFEYNAAVRSLRRIVASGELGDVFYVDTARLNLGLFQRDINVIWDLAPHDLSILLHVLQREPISVSARGGAHIHQGVHDVVFLELLFPDNILANVHLSWLYPRKERRVTIVGSKKMLVCDDVQELEKIRIYDKGVNLPSRMDQLPHETDQFFDFHLSYRYGDVSIPYVPFEEPLRAQCEHFLDCIRTGQRPLTDGREGLTVVRLIEAANRSLHDGGRRVPVGAGAMGVALAGVGAESSSFPTGLSATRPNGSGAHTLT